MLRLSKAWLVRLRKKALWARWAQYPSPLSGVRVGLLPEPKKSVLREKPLLQKKLGKIHPKP
jgi:hypothetical protein